jgi:DNA-binding GntR family transcriptional regulator
MTGRFDPGQSLTISSLADLFETSHMPVREALRRLVAENALEIASTGTAVVPTVNRARLDDLCNARVVVEGGATELAAPHIDARTIRALERMAEDHVDAYRDKSVPDMLARNQEFHFTIYGAAGSPVLLQMIETLWLRFGPYLRMLTEHLEPQLKTGDGESYTRHHFDIVAAFKAGDTGAARRHMEDDIRTTHALLQTLYPADTEA